MVGAAALAIILLFSSVSQEAQEGEASPQIVSRDLDGDGVQETVVIFRDADNNVVRAEGDSDADGIADMWATYGTNEQGQPTVELAVDRTGDGEPEEWHWAVANRLVRIGRDTRGDGVADAWSLLDERGLVVEIQGDTDGDGAVDSWSTIAPGGLTESTAYDTTSDGQPDRWIRYGPDGTIVAIERDLNGDGVPDEIIRQ